MATTLSLVVIFIPVSFMSSISGRFLYQFGITAAAAILVSLLVSFTLTPMMSARMLRRDAGWHGTRRGRVAGRLLRPDRALYMRLLEWSMRHRVAVVGVAVLIAASAVPLYGLVRQEYIPTRRRRGGVRSHGAGAGRGEHQRHGGGAAAPWTRSFGRCPAFVLVLAVAGASTSSAAVNQSNLYVRIAPHEERAVLGRPAFSRRWCGSSRWRRSGAITASARSCRRSAAGCARFRDLEIAIRNFEAFTTTGAGNFDINFAFRGPDLVQLSALAEHLRNKSGELGHRRCGHDAPARQAGAAGAHRPGDGRPTSASTPSTSPGRCGSWSAVTSRSPVSETPR